MDEVRDPIQLRCVGFCGADDTVDPAELKAISEQHGWVEWGVLFRPEKAGSPRFASDEWLERLGQVNLAGRMRLAGHLCAAHVDGLSARARVWDRSSEEQPQSSSPSSSSSDLGGSSRLGLSIYPLQHV